MTSFLLMSANTCLNATYSYDALNHSIKMATEMTNDFDIIPSGIYRVGLNSGNNGNQNGILYLQIVEGENSNIGAFSNKDLLWHTGTTYYPTRETYAPKVQGLLTKRNKGTKNRKPHKFLGGIKMNAKNVLEGWKNKVRNKKLIHKGLLKSHDETKSGLNWDNHLLIVGGANTTDNVGMSELEWTEETDDLEEDFDYSTDEREPLNVTGPIVIPLFKVSTQTPVTPVVITKFFTITKLVTLSDVVTENENVTKPKAVTTQSFTVSLSDSIQSDTTVKYDSSVSLSAVSKEFEVENDDIDADTEYDEVYSVTASHKRLATNHPNMEPSTDIDLSYSPATEIVKSIVQIALSTSAYFTTEHQKSSEESLDSSIDLVSKARHEFGPSELIEYEDGHLVLGKKQPNGDPSTLTTIELTTPIVPTPILPVTLIHPVTNRLFSILPIKGTTIILRPTSFPKFRSHLISSKTNNETTSDKWVSFTDETSQFNKSRVSKVTKLRRSTNFENLNATINENITALASKINYSESYVVARGAYSFTGVILPKKQFVLNSLSSVTKGTMLLPSCVFLLLIVVICL